jgi:AbrB family looped-hinge helix DNA binding protein
MNAVLHIYKSTLSSRGRLVIPVEIRKALGLQTGSELSIATRVDGVIELRPLRRRIEDLFSLCKAPVSITETHTDEEALYSAILEADTRTRIDQPQ